MSAHWQRRLTIANCFLASGIYVATVVFAALSIVEGQVNEFLVTGVALGPVILLLVGMGAVIVARRPGHLIGIGMCVTGLLASLTVLTDAYTTYAVVTAPGVLPAPRLAAWVVAWIWIPTTLPTVTLLFLLFPDGRLLTARWRLVARFALAVIGLLTLTVAFLPGPIQDFPQVTNPLGLGQEGGVVDLANTLAFVTVAPAIALSAAGMVVRFRRSSGLERQQFKWLTIAAVFSGIVFIASLVIMIVSGASVFPYTSSLIFASVPISVGLAILRYRLYDIDRIINRTLVYAALSAILAALYFGLVVALQALLAPLSGGSNLAIALTTLAVAALFLPARGRIQRMVDRRFNRRVYNAARTIDAFSSRLREAIDLDTLQAEVLAVLDETMQPAQASLWLRAPRMQP